ncbi:Proline-rich protein 5-like, partial [Nibea albiflora]
VSSSFRCTVSNSFVISCAASSLCVLFMCKILGISTLHCFFAVMYDSDHHTGLQGKKTSQSQSDNNRNINLTSNQIISSLVMCFHGNHLYVHLPAGDEQLVVLADMWDRFFTEILPTLQAIFYPVQGQELTVRQMALLAFRDLVLLKLHLEETLGGAASVPPAVTQMLLVLQGIHESGGPSLEYYQLERLVEIVVSPYLSNVLHKRNQLLLGQYH